MQRAAAAPELRERAEAQARATTEFLRVKRAKLARERAAQRSHGDARVARQQERERANRASAAASRAKIVCYARELERRTDRLESERNSHAARAERAERKLGVLRDEARKLKHVLRALWERKHADTCAYLVDSNALFLLASHAEEDSDQEDAAPNAQAAAAQPAPPRAPQEPKLEPILSPLARPPPPPRMSPPQFSAPVPSPAALPVLPPPPAMAANPPPQVRAAAPPASAPQPHYYVRTTQNSAYALPHLVHDARAGTPAAQPRSAPYQSPSSRSRAPFATAPPPTYSSSPVAAADYAAPSTAPPSYSGSSSAQPPPSSYSAPVAPPPLQAAVSTSRATHAPPYATPRSAPRTPTYVLPPPAEPRYDAYAGAARTSAPSSSFPPMRLAGQPETRREA